MYCDNVLTHQRKKERKRDEQKRVGGSRQYGWIETTNDEMGEREKTADRGRRGGRESANKCTEYMHRYIHTLSEKKKGRMGRGKRACTRGIYILCAEEEHAQQKRERERRRRVRVDGVMSNDTKEERHALASSDDKKPETYKPEESVLMLCCLRLVVDCQRWDPVFLEQEVVVKIFIFHKPSRKQD